MGPRVGTQRIFPLIEAFFFFFFKLQCNEAIPQKFTGKITSSVELFMQIINQVSVRKKDIFRQKSLKLFLPHTVSQETSRGLLC